MNTHASFTALLLTLALLLPGLSGCSRSDPSDLMAKAEEALKAGDTETAVKLLQEAGDYHAESPRAPEALFRLGTIYLNEQKDAAKAVTVFERLYRKHGNTEYAHKAMFLAAFTCANELQDGPKARRLYEEYLRLYPDSSMAESARFEMAHMGKSAEEVLRDLQNAAAATSPQASASEKKK